MTVVSDRVVVDHAQLAEYPIWRSLLRHPELNRRNPDRRDVAVYSLDEVQLWRHPTQEALGSILACDLYCDLVRWRFLTTCLSLRDLEEIQKLGVEAFERHFSGKYLFAWQSVISNQNGSLLVPYLFRSYNTVYLYWLMLEDRIGIPGVAGRLR